MRQVFALAAILLRLVDERFPATSERCSELIERFRRELGHPRPRLEDTPVRRIHRRARGRGRPRAKSIGETEW